MSCERILVPVIFHPPTPDEYNAEDVILELATGSKHVLYDLNYCDVVEGFCDPLFDLIKKYHENLDGFRKYCRLYFRPEFNADNILVSGTLELNVISQNPKE